jgi:hypothetical protein
MPLLARQEVPRMPAPCRGVGEEVLAREGPAGLPRASATCLVECDLGSLPAPPLMLACTIAVLRSAKRHAAQRDGSWMSGQRQGSVKHAGGEAAARQGPAAHPCAPTKHSCWADMMAENGVPHTPPAGAAQPRRARSHPCADAPGRRLCAQREPRGVLPAALPVLRCTAAAGPHMSKVKSCRCCGMAAAPPQGRRQNTRKC